MHELTISEQDMNLEINNLVELDDLVLNTKDADLIKPSAENLKAEPLDSSPLEGEKRCHSHLF